MYIEAGAGNSPASLFLLPNKKELNFRLCIGFYPLDMAQSFETCKKNKRDFGYRQERYRFRKKKQQGGFRESQASLLFIDDKSGAAS